MKFKCSKFVKHFKDQITNPKRERFQNKEGKLKFHALSESAKRTMDVFDSAKLSCELIFGKGLASYKGGENTEFLCDFTYSDEQQHKIFLAMESEWGKESSREIHFNAVIYDFKKLVNITSLVKVMIFAYHEATSRCDSNKSRILDEMSDILKNHVLTGDEIFIAFACSWDSLYSPITVDSIESYVWKSGSWQKV